MSLFTKDVKTKYIEPEAFPGAKKFRGALAELAKSGAMERITRAGQPYPGQLPGTAGPSEYEQMGLEGLGKYLQSPLPTEGSLFGLAKGELESTLGGEEYDPVQGTYYQAYRTAVQRELEEAKDRLASRTSARDKFFGGGRIATEGEYEEEAATSLQQVLGQLFERERERRLGAVGPAMQMATYEEAAPLARVEASQIFGALPRILEEAGLSAEYGEWIRQLGDLGIPLDVALGLSTWQPNLIAETTGGGPKNWVKDTAGIIGILSALSGLSGGGSTY